MKKTFGCPCRVGHQRHKMQRALGLCANGKVIMNVRRHSVFLQQPILAPYRLAFFRRLAQSPVISPTVVYGQEAPSSALRSVRDPEGISAICLRNVFIPSERFMTAQVGALTAEDVTHFDTMICSFDPRTITNAHL